MSVHNKLRAAVEDRFIILRLREDDALLPEGNILANLADTLSEFSGTYNVLCDWRGLKEVTNDVVDFVSWLCATENAKILAKPNEAEFIRSYFFKHPPILEVNSDSHILNYSHIELEQFDDDSFDVDNIEPFGEIDTTQDDLEKFFLSRYERSDVYSDLAAIREEEEEEEEEIKFNLDMLIDPFYDSEVKRMVKEEVGGEHIYVGDKYLEYRVNYLNYFIYETGYNSLLNEFVIQESGERMFITPYHSHALYPIEASKEVIIGKPGVIARKTGALFKAEMVEFQQILNLPNVRESQIQKFLEKKPNVLKLLGVGYAHIYPQVILQREDGTSLRPDFILQPTDNGWCDILDIKLPDEKVVVGGRDRKKFSAAVEELAAQLREYSAYFEDARLAKRIEDVYGIKCYRPRMVGVIGRSPRTIDARQLRRLETMYSDLNIITFDRLLEIANTRLLI